MIHLDTHVVVWLVANQVDRLPSRLRGRLEQSPLAWSPMVALELAFLHEIGRITAGADEVLSRLSAAVDATEDRTPFPDVARAAVDLTFTRDPFDRLIAAQSLAAEARLATSDALLRTHLDNTVWD